MDRKEFLDILSIMNHMAHADGQMHPAEKKVLIAVFKAAKVTPEEHTYFQDENNLDIALVRSNAKKILQSITSSS